MNVLLLPATLLLAASGGQDSAALVDGMIERSNALKSFVAEYQVHSRSPEGEPQETDLLLRIVYRAPGDLLINLGVEGERTRWVISGGTMSLLLPTDDNGPPRFGTAEEDTAGAQARSRIARAFGDQFPGLGDVGGPPGLDAYVNFVVTPGTSSKRPGFDIRAGMSEVGRGKGALLGWLAQVRRSKAALIREDDFLVWEAEGGFRISLRKDTGFIEKIVVTHEGETRTGLELQKLELNGEIDDAEFQIFKPDRVGEDLSEFLGAILTGANHMATRTLIYRKLDDAVEADKLEWTSDTRARLRGVLEVYHAEVAPLMATNTVHRFRTTVDKFCNWYQQATRSVSEGDAARANELEDRRIDGEARLRESIDKSIESYVALTLPDWEEASKTSEEMRALELEAAEAAYRESVIEPALEYFAEQMERARNGELPPAKN